MSTLLPPTAETLQHVLLQGGVSTRLATRHDSVFMSLLSETRAQLRSGSFEVVLDTCLDRATAILFSGLERNVFGGPSGGWDDPNLPLGPAQEPRVRLAGMLPGLARWGHLALQGLPNELIDVRTTPAPCPLPLLMFSVFLGARGRTGGGGVLCDYLCGLRPALSIALPIYLSTVLVRPWRAFLLPCVRTACVIPVRVSHLAARGRRPRSPGQKMCLQISILLVL